MATIAAIAGLASAGAAAYGAYSSNQNAAAARKQNAANAAAARRQQELANEQAEASLAPTRNARGDVTEYIPGVGWVERPSDVTRALMARSDNEELRRLAEDQPRARMQREHAFGQAQDDRGLANALLARMNQGTRSLADTEADAVRLNTAQQTAGKQQIGNAAMLTALRSGTGAQEMLAAQGKNGQADTRVALEQARSGAPRAFADAESSRMNDGLNRYQNLMSRALAPGDVPFQPSQLADNLSALRQKQQGTAAYGLATAMQGIKAPKIEVVDDNNATRMASAINGMKGVGGNLDTLFGGGGAMGSAADWANRQYYNATGFNQGKVGTEMYGPTSSSGGWG